MRIGFVFHTEISPYIYFPCGAHWDCFISFCHSLLHPWFVQDSQSQSPLQYYVLCSSNIIAHTRHNFLLLRLSWSHPFSCSAEFPGVHNICHPLTTRGATLLCERTIHCLELMKQKAFCSVTAVTLEPSGLLISISSTHKTSHSSRFLALYPKPSRKTEASDGTLTSTEQSQCSRRVP